MITNLPELLVDREKPFKNCQLGREEYANFGFDFILDKLEQDPNYFFKESAFLNVFTSFLVNENNEDDSDEPDDLD